MPDKKEKRSIAWIYTTYFKEDLVFSDEPEWITLGTLDSTWNDERKELYIEQIRGVEKKSDEKRIEMQEVAADYGTSYYFLSGASMQKVIALISFIEGGICYESEKKGYFNMSRSEQDQFLSIKLPILFYAPYKR